MTQNQKNALTKANEKRSQTAAKARIIKARTADKINNGRAILLLAAHAGLYKYQAVDVVARIQDDIDARII